MIEYSLIQGPVNCWFKSRLTSTAPLVLPESCEVAALPCCNIAKVLRFVGSSDGPNFMKIKRHVMEIICTISKLSALMENTAFFMEI